MTAISLFDVLAGKEADCADPQRMTRVTRFAAKLVESALADWHRVLGCEQEFASSEFATPETEAKIDQSLYEMYQTWVADAEQVLERTRKLAAGGYSVDGAQALEDAHGQARARLKLTPEMIARATQQVRDGHTVPIEELRNELRARLRA